MKKQIVFRDESKDDFAFSYGKIKTEKVDKKYKYINKNILWRIVSFFLYYVVCPPILYFYSKLKCGYRVVGREKLKKAKGGYFVYCNHTQAELDAFLPNLLSYPRRTYIITGPEATSIKGLRQIVKMLGALPVASTICGLKNMDNAIRARVQANNAIAIFPEAHIWPYYTKIRPFPSGSFKFPIRTGKPCFSFTVTYHDRYIFFHKCKRPGITVYVEGPFYPDLSVSKIQAQELLRQKVYDSMVKSSLRDNQVEYIEYVRDNNTEIKEL